MRVAIVGANGYLGRNIGRYLANNGIDVVGLDRGCGSSENIGLKVVEYSNDTNLASHFEGLDCVIHTVGISRQSEKATFFDVNYGITSRIVRSAVKVRLPRIVYVSGLGVDAENTESYFLSKYLAEREIIGSGLNYTILRPSYIIGPGDSFTDLLVDAIVGGRVTIFGSGLYRFQPVYIQDVARLFYEILGSRKADNVIIDVVGRDTISFLQYVELISEAIGIKPQIDFVDLEKAYQEALRNPGKGISVEELDVLIGDYLSSSHQMEEKFGVIPRTVKQALQDTINLSRSHSDTLSL